MDVERGEDAGNKMAFQEAKLGGDRIDDDHADEFVRLLDKKRQAFDEQENNIHGSGYKSERTEISHKSTISIRFKDLDQSAKKSQAGKSQANFSQILSTKVNTFKERQDQGQEFSEDGQADIGFYEVISKYADGKDRLLLYSGLFCAFIFGACFPAFLYLFGEMVDELGVSTSTMNYDFGKLNRVCTLTMILAAVVFASSCGQIVLTSFFADNIAFKISVIYFRKCLEKDSTYFDRNKPEKVAKKLDQEIKVLRSGLGENYGYVVQSFTAFLLGFIVAFLRGWLFALTLLPGFPVIICTGLMLAVAMSRRAAETAKSYAQCEGLSAQAIRAIKLVQSYGNEAIESDAYR